MNKNSHMNANILFLIYFRKASLELNGTAMDEDEGGGMLEVIKTWIMETQHLVTNSQASIEMFSKEEAEKCCQIFGECKTTLRSFIFTQSCHCRFERQS